MGLRLRRRERRAAVTALPDGRRRCSDAKRTTTDEVEFAVRGSVHSGTQTRYVADRAVEYARRRGASPGKTYKQVLEGRDECR